MNASMKSTQRCLGRLLLLCTLAVPYGIAAAAEDPSTVVQETADALLGLISEAESYVEEDPERFFTRVEKLLSSVVDFDRFARSVMATHYKTASEEQKRRFAENFKWGLVRTYALALTEYGGDGKPLVTKPPKQRNPKRQSIPMEIQMSSGDVYELVYFHGAHR